MYFVGLNWQDIFQADDRIGLAFGQPQKNESETTDPFCLGSLLFIPSE